MSNNDNIELSSQIHLSTNTSLSELSSLMKPNKKTKYDIEMNKVDIQEEPHKKYGHLRSFKFKDGDPQIVFGPLFPLCFIFNLLFPLYSLYYLYNTVHYLYYLLGIIVALFQISTFTYTSTINPGLPKAEYDAIVYQDKSNNYRQCKDCRMWINTEEGTQHCKVCNICIEGYDHHCGLMNICIGKHNLKAFYLYVLGSFLMVGFFVIGFLGHSTKKE